MGLKDYTGIINKHQVSFIKAEEVSEGYYKVYLEKDDISWKAGEHGIFTIDDHKIDGKGWRPFSFASIEKEGHILIGTRSIGEMSDFKKTLFSLNKGEKVNIRGPFGSFKIKDEKTPIVYIALGIGITPVRSMLKEIEDEGYKQDVKVIYSSEGYFMFKEEIEEIVKTQDQISIVYPTSVKDTKEEIKKSSEKYKNEAYYYIAGPPKAIESVKKDLFDDGISKKQILHDPFVGY